MVGAELSFDFPGSTVGFESFADPVKRVGCDFCKAPASWRAVCTRADLHDLVTDLAAGLALLVAAYWIDPADAPSLNCRIPDTQGGPIHVVRSIGVRLATGNARHNPDVRCLSFSYEPQYFEGLAAEAGVQSRSARFSTLRVPPVRALSSLVARACVGLAESGDTALDRGQSAFAVETEKPARNSLEHASSSNAGMTVWEDIGVALAARALEIANGGEPSRGSLPAGEARVTRIVRMI